MSAAAVEAIELHPSGELPPDAAAELSATVGRNLRRLRTRRGYSLERLAKAAQVSRGMLSQIELGKSTPTISLLWKIATALDVTFATLMATASVSGTVALRRAEAKILASSEGKFTSRALFPYDGGRRTEFYELRIAPGHEEHATPHAPGTVENLVLVSGALEVFDGVRRHALGIGDALLFEADVAHSYRNPGAEETVAYLVMSYAETVG